jgi:DNA repair protein RadC
MSYVTSELMNHRSNVSTLRDFDKSPRLSEIRAVYKSRTRTFERPEIRDAKDAEKYLRAIWNRRTMELSEDFVVICLNGNHEALGWVKVSSGGLNSSAVDPRIIFAIALQTASTAIILSHNHPSGNLTPSHEDQAVTRQLCEAGRLLSIRVLDHLILTKESSLSFAETGLIERFDNRPGRVARPI